MWFTWSHRGCKLNLFKIFPKRPSSEAERHRCPGKCTSLLPQPWRKGLEHDQCPDSLTESICFEFSEVWMLFKRFLYFILSNIDIALEIVNTEKRNKIRITESLILVYYPSFYSLVWQFSLCLRFWSVLSILIPTVLLSLEQMLCA